MKKVAVILAAALFYSVNLFAFPVDAENIPADKYFEITLNEINNAKSSVEVVMYLVSIFPSQPDSQANQLVNALIKAKERGVEVKVILDQNKEKLERAKQVSAVVFQENNIQSPPK